jgi:hypothetical protein
MQLSTSNSLSEAFVSYFCWRIFGSAMKNYLTKIFDWVYSHPIFSLLTLLFAMLSYGNLFYFGFRLGIPVALRPFLDSYFLTGLTLEFLVCVALAALSSRVVVLVSRFFLSNFSPKFSKTS